MTSYGLLSEKCQSDCSAAKRTMLVFHHIVTSSNWTHIFWVIIKFNHVIMVPNVTWCMVYIIFNCTYLQLFEAAKRQQLGIGAEDFLRISIQDFLLQPEVNVISLVDESNERVFGATTIYPSNNCRSTCPVLHASLLVVHPNYRWGSFRDLTPRWRLYVWHYAESKYIFLNENCCLYIHISMRCIPKRPTNNKPSFLWLMVWHRIRDKPLS